MYQVSQAHCQLERSVSEAYVSNDSVPVMVGNKVLDGPCWSCSKMIATNEMGFQIELGGVRARILRT